jgi:Tfp pilus assembly protein PilF
MFDKGDRAQALNELQSFLAREPQVQTISEALARMTGEADRIAAENLRREKIAGLARAAEAALSNGDPEQALEQAREALAIDASDALAQKIQSLASARLRERVLAEERMKQAVQALEDARGVLKRGKFAAARQLAHQAAELRPGDEEPASLLVQIGEEESRARESAQRQAETTRRAAAAAPVLAMAKATEEKHDFIGAEWLAENALALDPDCIAAQEILTRVRVRMLKHARASNDEIVRVSGRVSADSDDTVTVNPSRSSWQTRAKTWIQRVGELIMNRLPLRGLLQRAKPPRLS